MVFFFFGEVGNSTIIKIWFLNSLAVVFCWNFPGNKQKVPVKRPESIIEIEDDQSGEDLEHPYYLQSLCLHLFVSHLALSLSLGVPIESPKGKNYRFLFRFSWRVNTTPFSSNKKTSRYLGTNKIILIIKH